MAQWDAIQERFDAMPRAAVNDADRLRKYLAAYTAIMEKQRWAEGFMYVDAFAGAGRARVRQTTDANEILDFGPTQEDEDPELSSLLDGSPAVALDVRPPFSRYVFLERDQTRAQRLESLKATHRDRAVDIEVGDSNDYLRRMCPEARYLVIDEIEDLPDALTKVYRTLTA